MTSLGIQLILISWCLVSCYGNYNVGNFSDQWSHGFNHLTVHNNGDVYVGGVNSIYKLDSDLKLQYNESTGPAASDGSDVHNKILTIDYVDDKLVVCGSYHGFCETRSITDLSYIEGNNLYVAADTADDSTVGFVAPGYDDKYMLYVGTTRTENGYGTSLVSGRQLDSANLFAIINVNRMVTQIAQAPSKVQPDFRINYKFLFSYGKYTYFLNTQHLDPMNPNLGRISKIARVCQEESSNGYESFTEIRLTCAGDDDYLIEAAYLARPGRDLAMRESFADGEQALFAVFTKDDKSALCMYEMMEIEGYCSEAVERCVANDDQSAQYSVQYLEGVCTPGSRYLAQMDCFASQHSYAGSDSGLNAGAVAEYVNEKMTAIAVMSVEGHTVGFLGTSTGQLSKLHITSASTSNEYETLPIDGEQLEVLADMSFDVDKEHLYVPTQNTVHKVKVEDCNQYTTCESCFASQDPYCGWCTLERRCSLYSDCPLSNQSLRWIDVFSPNLTCVYITSVEPTDSSPITVQGQINVTVAQLPPLQNQEKYHCYFNDNFVSEADKTGNQLTCDTLNITDRPRIPPGEDHVTTQLSIYSTETQVAFVDTDFHFFECETHTSCTACVTSNWACDWCIYNNRCTHNSTGCPDDDNSTVVVGLNNIFGPEKRKDQEFCPQLMEQNEILVPKDMAREIHLQAQSLPVLKDGYTGYKCILTVEGSKEETTAKRQNETYIICSSYSYTYQAEEQEMIAKVTVTWNDNHVLDDLYNNTVTLYDCSVDREDCSLCLSNITTRPELECGWCRDAGAEVCQIQDQCQDWLYQEPQSCGDPKIHNVWPLAGPVEGGTEVQINGSNMGTMFSDIVSVTVADIPCDPIKDKYEISRSITCITKKCNCEEQNGNVVVTIVHGRTDTSADTYDYRNPVVKDFNPKIGPIAGGTLVTVTGDYMDSGRNINVFIGDSECTVNRGEVNATAIPCRTSEYSQPDSFNVVVNFDGAERPAPTDAEFNYAENPTVTHLSPLESSLSGGRMIEVNGTRFDVPGEARMTIKEGDVVFYSDPCVVKSQGSMECKTPRVEVSSSSRRKRDTDCVEGCDVEVGFQMDGYVTVMPDGFTIFVDPEYFEFEDDDQIASYTSVIQIRGRHLDFAATASEVTVYIGQEYCIVQSLSSVQLNCEPPAESPDGVDKNGTRTENGLPEVRVEVGNLGFYIGYLEYPRNTLSSGVIGGLAGGILGVLVAAAIIIVIFCIRRSSKKSQKLEGMAKMLDDLEMNVQSEAKRAFTELQTEMSDLNSDVEGSIGIPVLDYDDYAVNMMFAGQTDHPVFQKSEVVLKSSTITGLKQFYHLLKKKHFLLIFIETLEAQKGVSPRDRVNIGSLLTVALHSEKKMVYLTDVLKTLLANAAAKAVDRSKEKQMLRRTESVMEKLLTNWFVLTLYDFLKDTAASPIFLLYRALKHQIEKGPVDSVTGLAKYSLTDDLLLTERLDESALNVNIVTTWDGKADVQARLLDVDTVSQSKEKILDVMYKNTRYSKKPLVRDIDLEWRAGRDGHGHLTLQDQDVSSEIEGNWKRLNTLQHYKIPDGSNLALVYKDNAVNVNSNIRTPITVANEYDFVHFHDPDMVPDVVNSANSKAHILSSDEDLNEENEEEQSALKVWHLIKSKNYHTSVYDQQSNKKQKKKKTQPAQKTKRIISELYLTQLITTKHTVQKFVDDAFQTLLKFERQQFPRQFPPAIKYMFDFLDGLAERHDVDDPDITHIWKSNSLPLRMWANILKCPHFVFDVNVNQTLTASLEVISQAFVDSCSKIERKIGKDTPPAKMLYNNDVKVYKPVVDMYYEDIKRQSPISEKEFGIYLEESFVELGGKFDKMSAISELYKYATKYGGDLLDALEESEVCKKENLAFQLEQVAARMAENDYGEVVV